MKKTVGIFVMLVMLGLVIGACQGGGCLKGKAPEGAPAAEGTAEKAPPAGGGAAVDKISKSLSEVLCKRMVECAPGTLTEDDCVTQTTASLTEAQKEKPITVSDAQLQACVDSISKGTCETVLGTEPPSGCEFLR